MKRRPALRRLPGPCRVGLALAAFLPPWPALAQAPDPVSPPAAGPISDEDTPVPDALVRPVAGGLRAADAGVRAEANSFTLAAALEALRGAQANVDRAAAALLPRFVASAQYTRYSELPPSKGPASVSVVLAPTGTSGPVTSSELTAVPYNLAIRPLVDQYTLEASASVPLSAYVLQLNHLYAAAKRSEDAARLDVASERARSHLDGVTSYYEWLRGREGVIVATLGANASRAYLRDVRHQRAAGLATAADVERAETSVLDADMQLAHADALSAVAEAVLRSALRAGPDVSLSPGQSLFDAPAPLDEAVDDLVHEALRRRPEIRSATSRDVALRERSAAARAGAWPSLGLTADGYYANPAPREVQQNSTWSTAWDVGAFVSWSPTDVPGALADASAMDAQARELSERRAKAAQSIALEVQSAYAAAREADSETRLADRRLERAAASVTTARALFLSDQTTALVVEQAKADLQRARVARLEAYASAQLARTNLEHAVGRDVH
jgi:outer membrane protein TolC